jgi:O-antigen/teichoic acid export membrane protein
MTEAEALAEARPVGDDAAVPAGPGRRALARNSAIAAGAVVGNGLLSAAMLALSAASGQVDEIAAYTVVTSALAIVLIVVGGGSTLLYLNGTEDERSLVRSQWTLVVLPSLLLGAVAVSAFYVWWRGYSPTALAAAGVVVFGNGLAQLQTADFSRQMRFLAGASLLCGSKATSLLMVVFGVPLTVALATAGLAQFLVGEVMLGRQGSLRLEHVRRLSGRSAVAAYRSGGSLFGYAVGEQYVARLGTVVLSLVATRAVMGSFGTVVTAYQAIGGVVQSALQVPMVARARSRLGIESANHPARFSVAVALVCSVPMAAVVAGLSPWLTGALLSLPHRQSAGWLALFMLALPFMAVTRALMFDWIGDGHYRRATYAVGLLAAVLTVTVAVGVPWFGPIGAAGATAAAEMSVLAVLLVFARRSRTHRSRV